MTKQTLTHEQLKVVLSNCKVNTCLAVPGSGKTTVLTRRVERLWQETKEPILVCTFSNKAVKDITKKIDPEILQYVKIQTIHSLCYNIVKSYWSVVGELIGGDEWPKEPVLVDKIKELELIDDFLKDKDKSKFYDKLEEFRAFNMSPHIILRLFKKGVYFGKFSQQDIEVWAKYEKYRLAKGYINFDDMAELAAMIMPIPEVAIGTSKLYRHILIDEAQDTSEAQWTVLRPLVAHAETVLVVGDVNQSVYGWRCADGSVLSGLGYLQNSVVFKITESFRSGSLVAKFANMIVRDKSSQIRTKNEPSTFTVTRKESREEEVDYVLSKADKDTAIISRTNSYLEAFERECIRRQINYTGSSFYRSLHIRNLWRTISNFDDDKNMIEFIEKGYCENITYTNIEREDFKLAVRIIKKEGVSTFKELMDKSNSMNDEEALTLTTGHAAKGLEWPKVFVVGCHNGQIPHRLSTDDDEERNLFYVCVTREAGKGLEITYVKDPSRYLNNYSAVY